MTGPRVSIVVPAFHETETIVPVLRRLDEAVSVEHEILVIVDSTEDPTIDVARPQLLLQPSARILVQDLGPGPANAIRFGMGQACAPCIVVSMADGSDEVELIDEMVRAVEGGHVLVAASRYMQGGRHEGGTWLKACLSRLAGQSLYWLAGVGTRDATNSFKAYDRAFVQGVGIHSRGGFEIGIELVAKARRANLPVAEMPTVWVDRPAGESRFRLAKWLPLYLRWYVFALGSGGHKVTPSQAQQWEGLETA